MGLQGSTPTGKVHFLEQLGAAQLNFFSSHSLTQAHGMQAGNLAKMFLQTT